MKDNTLNYYNNNSKEYFEKTKSAATTALYKEFLENIPVGGSILDLGCGSGRDSLYFMNNGYNVTLIDGSSELAKEASQLLNHNVIVSRFEELKLEGKYDGIWACASLLHVNREDIVSVLKKLAHNLKDGAVFYLSFKYGENEYIDDNGRYFNCYTDETFKAMIKEIKDFRIKDIYKTGDTLGGREGILWLNILLQRD